MQILYRLSIIKLTHFYKLCFFPILLLSYQNIGLSEHRPIRTSAYQNIGKIFDEGNWVALRLIAPQINALLPKTGTIANGIASACAPCDLGLFRCGYLQHGTWPKATKSILNPSARAN